jgi:hypothetical protein
MTIFLFFGCLPLNNKQRLYRAVMCTVMCTIVCAVVGDNMCEAMGACKFVVHVYV